MKKQPYHDPTGDQMEHAYFCYLADKFEADPDLLGIALETVERWLAKGSSNPRRHAQWRELLEAAKSSEQGMNLLSKTLRDDDEETRFFKGFAPFPAVLSQQEKRQFLCASRH